MSKSKRERREKFGLGEKITYGRPAPGMPQGPNNQDMNPMNFRSMAPSMASMSGKTQNPFMDAEAFVPQTGAPGGGNIATFSGQDQNKVMGRGYNQMPPEFHPSWNQAGSSTDTDGQESQRIATQVMNQGLYAGPMGLANPGMQQVPGGVPPEFMAQTQNTLPPQGIKGGLAQGGEDQKKKPNRGGRSNKGMTT